MEERVASTPSDVSAEQIREQKELEEEEQQDDNMLEDF